MDNKTKKSNARQKAAEQEKKTQKEADCVVSTLMGAVFVVFLVVAVCCSWKLTMSNGDDENLLLLEANTALYHALGAAGVVTVLLRKPPNKEKLKNGTMLRDAMPMAISFVVRWLFKSYPLPWAQFVGYILEIPLNIGINWFFIRLGYQIEWQVKHSDKERVERVVKVLKRICHFFK